MYVYHIYPGLFCLSLQVSILVNYKDSQKSINDCNQQLQLAGGLYGIYSRRSKKGYGRN